VSGATRAEAFRNVIAALQTRNLYAEWPVEEMQVQTRLEAQTLLSWVTGLTPLALLADFQLELTAAEVKSLATALRQRLNAVPLAYITGQVDFYGHTFRVSPACLIPRPDTEILVDAAVQYMTRHNPTAHVYDLGCGSGIIGLSAGLACPGITVESVDISPEAAAVAAENADQLQASNVTVRVADGLADLRSRIMGLDIDRNIDIRPSVLLSNPPYIPSHDVTELEADVRDFEPRLALDGGEDGLNYYRALAELGNTMFADGPAAFFWEVGIYQSQSVLKLCTGPHWAGWKFSVIPDLRGIERVVSGVRE
jgi:release factor glutamine methyltransferase